MLRINFDFQSVLCDFQFQINEQSIFIENLLYEAEEIAETMS